MCQNRNHMYVYWQMIQRSINHLGDLRTWYQTIGFHWSGTNVLVVIIGHLSDFFLFLDVVASSHTNLCHWDAKTGLVKCHKLCTFSHFKVPQFKLHISGSHTMIKNIIGDRAKIFKKVIIIKSWIITILFSNKSIWKRSKSLIFRTPVQIKYFCRHILFSI